MWSFVVVVCHIGLIFSSFNIAFSRRQQISADEAACENGIYCFSVKRAIFGDSRDELGHFFAFLLFCGCQEGHLGCSPFQWKVTLSYVPLGSCHRIHDTFYVIILIILSLPKLEIWMFNCFIPKPHHHL